MPSHQTPFLARPTLRRLVFAGLLIAVAIGLRFPGIDKTIWNLDEGSTFTMAEMVRDGSVLYLDAADNRTPLVPYAKALMFAVVGDWNIQAVHLIIAGMLGLTAVLLWLIGTAANDRRTGALSAIIFTFLSFVMLTVVDTMSAHTGWFLIFFSGIGMWLFLLALRKDAFALAISSGVAFALAALSKQPGLLDWGVCFIICLLAAWMEPRRWRSYLRTIAGLIVGLTIPLCLTYWYFKANGAWNDFLRYAWNYNTQLYVPEVSPMDRLLGIKTPFLLLQEHAPYALVLGVIGAVWLLSKGSVGLVRRTGQLPVLLWLILGWTASGLASTILSGRDFAHYSIQVLPGLSLACAWVTVRLWGHTATWKHWARNGMKIALCLGLLSFVGAALHRSATFDTKESLSQDIGKIISAETSPNQRIFVWGYEPELYVFSQRLPSTRFIYAVFLTGLIPWTNVDPLIDTTYAIVPGSWDDFWDDFEQSPPTMIIDTHGNRGFLKYPLPKQKRLWNAVERDYVEVTNLQARSLGYSLYKRTVPLTEVTPQTATESSHVSIASSPQVRLSTVRVLVEPPAGSQSVTLFFDGKPYRRINCRPDSAAEFNFFVPQSDLSEGKHRFYAIAEGTTILRSSVVEVTVSNQFPKPPVIGPPIELGDLKIDPFEVETLSGNSIVNQTSQGYWQTNAPTTLSYHRPPSLASIEFTLKFKPEAYDGSQAQKSDGADVVVRFTGESGVQSTLYHRHLDPVASGRDQGLIITKVNLPISETGILTLLITPGTMNISSYDWIEMFELKGEYSPISLSFHNQQVRPLNLNAELGIDIVEYEDRRVVFAHAPSCFDIPQVNGLGEISGEFGFLPSAWEGPKKSAGAIFSVKQQRADGSKNLLFTQTLYPAKNIEDRKIQHFRVPVSSATDALLHFSILPADPKDNGFNHTFWHALRGWDFTAQITQGNHSILSVSSDAPNGFAKMDEAGQEVLFAHAPSRLVFPLPADAQQLTGKIGLLRRSYTGNGNTDGVTFIIELEDLEGHRTVLLERVLQPHTVVKDQGSHDFSVKLPDLPKGQIILRTEPSATGRLDFAWSYWEDLHFDP